MTEIIEILYKGTEFQIELNKENEKYNYDLFLENLKEKITDFSEKSTLKLMTINTKEPYLLINENNFEDIINHERNGNNLKIIVNLTQNNLKNPQINNSSFEKKESDFRYEKDLSNENINNEKKISNKIEDDNLKNLNEDNKTVNNEIDNNNSVQKTNNILKGELCLKSEEIYKKLKENEKKYIEIKQKKKNPFKNEICMICNKEIEYIKYLCCFCDKFSCCENCEKNHSHTMFKYKDSNISYIFSSYKFIEKTNNFKLSNSINPFNIFSIEILIEPECDLNFSMRPNQKIKVPIIIKNLSNTIINSDNFIVIVRNFFYMNIKNNDNKNFIINPKSNYQLIFDFESFEQIKTENIEFLLFSNEINIKENEKNKFNIKVDINNDPEEIALNKFFSSYESILLLNKEHKKKILECVHKCNKNITPNDIYILLKKNNWNIEICNQYL